MNVFVLQLVIFLFAIYTNLTVIELSLLNKKSFYAKIGVLIQTFTQSVNDEFLLVCLFFNHSDEQKKNVMKYEIFVLVFWHEFYHLSFT